MRPLHALVAAALVVLALYGATVAGPPPVDAAGTPDADRLVAPDGAAGGYLWPYTSRNRSAAGRTLALNVVVRGEPSRVRHALTHRSGVDWNTTAPEAALDVSPWRPAHGSVRYTYLARERNATGDWVRPDYQLQVGNYFGQRTHVRAYGSPTGNWTALQAHTEYWDWLRLRHTVTGVPAGGQFVATDLADEPFVAGVSRTDHGLTGGGSDGSWTVVDLVPAAVLGGVVLSLGRRPGRRHGPTRLPGALVLPAALLTLVLGVRAGGIVAGSLLAGVEPKLFVALGYPLLAAGPPALVALFGRDRPPVRTALLAAAGLGSALVLELSLAGLPRFPARLGAHRFALVAALALLTLGVAGADRRVRAAGLVAWVAVLAAPLAGLL